ncbi:hypothetical protein LCGC14_0388340 [marine sediment metagenome]|uniref:DNA cytosine methyltransferase n=1 Tax=marine sediment metagenome TaxID=412755 RepID=A0A0F9TIA8_9ZZZZ
MKILLACEESQVVCKAFRDKGHEAYSCDILETSGDHPEWHIVGDVQAILNDGWDMMIAFPPCTRLTNSGVRWLAERDLWYDLKEAIKFWHSLAYAKEFGIKKMGFENPIPHKYAREGFRYVREESEENFFVKGIGKYTQIIQPWQFGHGEQKATCLWLTNLPKLKPTNIVTVREQKIWKMSPGPERSKLRSKTYQGIANAMADQWG